MSDTNQNSKLADRTQAELENAQQTGAQLEQERERLRAIANAYRECEARLQLTREQIEQLISNSAPANAESPTPGATNVPDDAAVQNIFDLLNQLGTDPFAMINPKVPNTPQPEAQNNPALVQTPNASSPGVASEDLNDALFPPGGMGATPFVTGENPGTSQRQAPTGTIGSTGFVPPAPAPSASAGGVDFSIGADAQVQALQAAGERLRTALEQNTQFTAALFEQMLTLVDNQNRKLGQVDQKISELSGQLQSLKNP